MGIGGLETGISGDNESTMAGTYDVISVEDFPQIWQRPTFEELSACLKQLHLEPLAWNATPSGNEPPESTARQRREVVAYLSAIVSSALMWIQDDEQKEMIWEAASRCLSQRCGRAGMVETTRRWPFREGRPASFELSIREPPITGDALGHKTWGSSFLMARLLDDLMVGPLAHLLAPDRRQSSLRILELGSGTGLLGIAAAAMWGNEVVLSDLPDIMPNLDYNIDQNRTTVETLSGRICSGALTWGLESGNDTKFSRKNQFHIILTADGVYDDNHPALLSSAIQSQLVDSLDARVVVMAPIRDQITIKLIEEFKTYMKDGSLSLIVLEEHSLTGEDDWGGNDESRAIECWWALFGREST